MAEAPDCVIGVMGYQLAVGYYDETGLRPMRRRYGSLFPGRTNTPGQPGVQNLRDDDLRWVADSFAGGEGQRVIDATDPASFRRFDRAQTIDFSNPGEMRLARQMEQQASTGGAVTTLECSTWTDDVGVSTVVGSDRRLNNEGDAIKVSQALAAGNWQFDFYGYIDPATQILGSALVEETKHTSVSGSTIRLKSEGATARTTNQDPVDGDVTVVAHFTLPAPAKDDAHAAVKLVVYNQTAGEKVAEVHGRLRAHSQTDDTVRLRVSFRAKANKTYRYKVTVGTLVNAPYVAVDWLTVDEGESKSFGWQVKDGATVLASGSVDMKGITESQKIASATINLAAPTTITLVLTRAQGTGRQFYGDRATYHQPTINAPRTIELGLNDLIWMVDYSAGAAPALWWWDAVNTKWVSIGTFGVAGDRAVAMAHGDLWEFVASSDKKVYRGKDGGGVSAYSDAMTNDIVGLAVGGHRLLILTESSADGTTLFDTGLDGTAPVTPTERYSIGNAGVSSPDLPQRMAGTRNGAVFFLNQGPDCWVYEYDGSAGYPIAKMETGFKGRAIAHANGRTWIAGGFPTVDSTGATNERPTVFVIDDATREPVQLDIKLHRDEDPTTVVWALQLFGPDIFVVTEVQETPRLMRIWRISRRDPIAAYLEHEITLDETQESGNPRGIAVTGQDTFAIWSAGGPYRRTTDYNVRDPAIYTSSRYGYGLTEMKRLDEFEVVGVIPEGCSVELSYEVDDSGTEVLVGSLEEPGKLPVSTPDNIVLFRTLRWFARLYSTDVAVSPIIYSIGVRAYCPVFDRTFELLLLCADESSVWHMDGGLRSGSEGIEYLLGLADAGALVYFEDRFSSKDPGRWRTYTVSVQTPDIQYLDNGEGLVRVILQEKP